MDEGGIGEASDQVIGGRGVGEVGRAMLDG